MAYEKNTKREMIIAPSTGSSGTSKSHGKNERKYWPETKQIACYFLKTLYNDD